MIKESNIKFNYDYKKTEGVKDFNKELFPNHFLCLICGKPGSGKTTVGRVVAKRLNKKFVDIDALIVQNENMTIQEIFQTKGEQYFRDVESQIILEVSQEHGQVISTGGGVILREKNIDNLKSNGRIFFYDRDIKTFKISSHRPLLKTKEDLLKLYNDRYDLYVKYADHIIKNPISAIVGAKKIEGEFLIETTNY